MTLKKRIEQEIASLKKAFAGENYESPLLVAYENVLKWIEEGKVTRKPKFVMPLIGDVAKEFYHKGVPQFGLEAEQFYAFYDSKNWMVGKNKMSNWKSAVAGWINRNKAKEDADGRNSNYYPETGSELHQPSYKRSEKSKPVKVRK